MTPSLASTSPVGSVHVHCELISGNMVSLYGMTGVPNFDVKIDGEMASAAMSAVGDMNGNGGRPLIYEKEVPYGQHTFEFTNNDGYFLLDSIEVSMILGAEG